METEIEYLKSFRIHSKEDSGYNIAIFDRKTVEVKLGTLPASTKKMTSEAYEELIHHLTGWTEFYRGPGRAFGTMPIVKLYKHKVLVRQFTGLDI